jgi:anti-anti-sigma regulatory factor
MSPTGRRWIDEPLRSRGGKSKGAAPPPPRFTVLRGWVCQAVLEGLDSRTMQNPSAPPVAHGPPRLRARTARGSDWLGLRLDGVIDEHNRLDEITAALPNTPPGTTLVIDLGGVSRLNSVGVRDWVLALRGLRARFESIRIIDCTPPVMNEVNFVRNFAEGALIASFQAPTFCTRCSREGSALIPVFGAQDGRRLEALPSFACERTDCENALDDDESSYLAFLDSQPPSTDAAALGRQLDAVRAAFAAGAGDPVRTSVAEAAPEAAAGKDGAPPAPVAPSPQGATAHAGTEGPGRTDVVFYVAIGAMVIVLAVLVYLIATLE